MEPITIKSKMDFKISLNIAMRNYFTRWLWIFLPFIIIGTHLSLINQPFTWLSEYISIGVVIGAVTFLLPLSFYRSCKRNMKQPTMREELLYHISNDKIEAKGETVSFSTTWEPVKKAQEFNDYFVLTNKGGRSFHYLPKNGFSSSNDMELLKEMVKHNRIKAYFK